MNTIENVMSAITERTIARVVAIPHDEARVRYSLDHNTVKTFDEFSTEIGEFWNYQFSTCFSNGGRLAPDEARARAKELIERAYRERGGDLVTAYNDAHDGTNNGLRTILDLISDGLKEEAVRHYVQEVFDRFVAPNSWDDKVQIIREFIERCGPLLSDAIDADHPERYAHNYRDLIQSFVQGLRRTSSLFRSL